MSWQEILISLVIILTAPVWVTLLVVAVLAMWVEKKIHKALHPNST